MIDIQVIRDNPKMVEKKAKQKGVEIDAGHILKLDRERRRLVVQQESIKQQRNLAAEAVKGGRPSDQQIEHGKKLKEQDQALEAELDAVEGNFNEIMMLVPNMPLGMVPVGESEDDNVVTKTVGDKPKFDFEPKNHAEIAEAKGWIDKERAVKVAGARFVYLKGDLVLLEMAMWRFVMDVLTSQATLDGIIAEAGLSVSNKPYEPILPPLVANTEAYKATGRLNKEDQTYKLEDEDLWLNASGEHTVAPMYMNEILDDEDLPIRYIAYTTAFRREAGTYGKDMEGILRLHQFNKMEMESFSTKDQSEAEFALMLAIQEYLMQKLEIPYQVLEKCTADIGGPNARGVDIEAWLPGQDRYRETHTADFIGDFQTRRMKTRTRNVNGKVELAHTTDGTALSERPLIAILENYQTAEGDVVVPAILKPYMGGREKI
ncbi:MAG: serine--tRNA ligase [bacterium]|nr:serine--tRNA ligase [bacterium]